MGRGLRTLAIRVAGGLAVLLVLSWIVAGSESFQACLDDDGRGVDETSYVNVALADAAAPGALQCTGDFLDQNEPLILALTALSLMFFGFAVWGIGTRVQRAFLAQVPARAEAARTRFRAQTGLETVHLDSRNGLRLTVKNFGPTAAHKVRFAALCSTQPPSQKMIADAPSEAVLLTLFSGQTVTIAVSGADAMAALERAKTEGTPLYVSGCIRHVDVYGRHWRTHFCRISARPAEDLTFEPFGPFNDEIREV